MNSFYISGDIVLSTHALYLRINILDPYIFVSSNTVPIRRPRHSQFLLLIFIRDSLWCGITAKLEYRLNLWHFAIVITKGTGSFFLFIRCIYFLSELLCGSNEQGFYLSA
jgi:hypothetical protein